MDGCVHKLWSWLTVGVCSRDYPKSQDEWLQLLERQQFLHETEIKRWKEVLSVVIKLMDQMKLTLVELEQSIARTSTVESTTVGT